MEKPDLWQSAISLQDYRPTKLPDSGYFAVGPWEPVHAFLGGDHFFTLWKRPLRKVNESPDSGDILR